MVFIRGSWSWRLTADKGTADRRDDTNCGHYDYIMFEAASWPWVNKLPGSRCTTDWVLWVAPAFLCGTQTPHSSVSSICDALLTPFPHQYVGLCHTLFSASWWCLYGNKVRGVQPKPCLVWRCEPRRTPHTKSICCPVSAPTRLTPARPLRWTPC